MKLWVRLSLAMALLAVVPVVLATGEAVRVATAEAEEASQEALRTEARLRAEAVSLWLGSQSRLVANWPQLLGGNRMLQLSPEALSAFPIAVFRGTPGAQVVAMIDGTGALVAPVVPPGADDRARALVARTQIPAVAQDPDRVHVGAPWFPVGSPGLGGVPSVPLAVLAAGAEAPEHQRILLVEVALSLDASVFPSNTPSHAVALLGHDGVPLFGGGGLVEPDRLREVMGTSRSADFSYQQPAGEVRGALVPVGNAGWTVVVVEPASAVLASASKIRASILPAVALAASSAVLLALIVARTLSIPVERLRDAASQVAEGKLGVQVNVRRSDELGDLARTFDHMSGALRTHRDEIEAQRREIEAFNRELVARVDERTRELRDAQEELVRAGQLAAVAELGAGLSHELNNPLAAVLGLAQLLRAERPDEPLLGDLEREAARCREVVATLQRVQTFAPRGADPDSRAPSLPPIDLHEVPATPVDQLLSSVRDLVAGSFRQRGVTLELEAAPGLVRVDPVEGARVLAQLLNAMRAGLPSGARVRVGAGRDGDDVTIDLAASEPIAAHPDHRDDWMASGHGRWVARQLLHRLGGRVDEGPDRWRVRLPGGSARATPLDR
jgi:two-component system NtrC family sensor kinase